MSNSKHTKGEVRLADASRFHIGVRDDNGFICFIPFVHRYQDQEQRFLDERQQRTKWAELIADAFAVEQKTGFTPSELQKENAELLEQRKELLEAAEWLYGMVENWQFSISEEKKMEALFLKAKGKQ